MSTKEPVTVQVEMNSEELQMTIATLNTMMKRLDNHYGSELARITIMFQDSLHELAHKRLGVFVKCGKCRNV